MSEIKLREFRTSLGLTQEEFALKLSKDGIALAQDQVSRWERYPESVPAWVLTSIQRVFGVSVDQFYPADGTPSTPKAPLFDNPYIRRTLTLKILKEYLDSQGGSLTTIVASPKVKKVYEELDKLIMQAELRPLIACVGAFNSTKSSLINWLLGAKLIPVRWVPTTPLPIYIVSRTHRPPHMTESDAVVHILKSIPEGQSYRSIITTPELYSELCVDKNGYDLLRQYADHEVTPPRDASAIIMFADAPVLRACDLCDTPGFDAPGGDADEVISSDVITQADAYLLLSPITNFLRGIDVTRLNDVLSSPSSLALELPPLYNTLIVATRADEIVPESFSTKEDEITDTIKKILDRIWSKGVIAESVNRDWEKRGGIRFDDLTARVTPFSSIDSQFRTVFVVAFRSMLDQLAIPIIERTKTSLEQFKQDSIGVCDNEIVLLESVLRDRDNLLQEVHKMKEQMPIAKERLHSSRMHALEAITASRSSTTAEFEGWWLENLRIEAVEKLIRDRNWTKKDAQDFLAETFLRRAQDKMNNAITTHFEHGTKPSLDALFHEYSVHAKTLEVTNTLGHIDVPFDFQSAAAAALSGLTAMGGLAIWAASLGSLGWYILTAKAVSVLASMGISIAGGTAAAISTVAALGGPIVWAAAGVIIVVVLLWRLFSKSWERRLAEQFVGAMKEKQVDEQFRSTIGRFFDDTSNGLQKFCDSLESEFDDHVMRLEKLAGQTDPQEVRLTIAGVTRFRDFFRGAPLQNEP